MENWQFCLWDLAMRFLFVQPCLGQNGLSLERGQKAFCCFWLCLVHVKLKFNSILEFHQGKTVIKQQQQTRNTTCLILLCLEDTTPIFPESAPLMNVFSQNIDCSLPTRSLIHVTLRIMANLCDRLRGLENVTRASLKKGANSRWLKL